MAGLVRVCLRVERFLHACLSVPHGGISGLVAALRLSVRSPGNSHTQGRFSPPPAISLFLGLLYFGIFFPPREGERLSFHPHANAVNRLQNRGREHRLRRAGCGHAAAMK